MLRLQALNYVELFTNGFTKKAIKFHFWWASAESQVPRFLIEISGSCMINYLVEHSFFSVFFFGGGAKIPQVEKQDDKWLCNNLLMAWLCSSCSQLVYIVFCVQAYRNNFLINFFRSVSSILTLTYACFNIKVLWKMFTGVLVCEIDFFEV